MPSWESNEEIQIFREYLQIPSVHPDIDYEPCIEFLKKQAKSLELPYNIYTPSGDPKKPIFIMTWIGTEPSLPSVVLNSHMDVVPVFPEKWTHPPFSADVDSEGRIFARGSQDMKCVGVQYLAAIRALKKEGITLKRTIHIIFVPGEIKNKKSTPKKLIYRLTDEEIGGVDGMKVFVHAKEFKDLNAGFSLDEGLASENDVFAVYYAERSIWKVTFHCNGTAGHGSLLLHNTAGVKLNYILNKMTEFRSEESKKLDENPNLTIGDVTTVNLTMINGGVQSNVIPPLMSITFDVRIAIDRSLEEFESMVINNIYTPRNVIRIGVYWKKFFCSLVHRLAKEAGGDIDIEIGQKELHAPVTKMDATNKFWVAFKEAIDELGLKIRPQVFPGGTDSRFIRAVNIPAIGFSPIYNTPVLLHDHDEFLPVDVYLRGIEIYKKIIPKVANI
ncbi:Aminoacylase-1 [Pseudolycoriella hygida]|uniref:N-acyl-aliphatic-L-amino acid amidohydrolase n=1 Tax=Pseudolycoriella hygida TaxID=35572 RepID=A0A9Q0MWP3_9DIPT|nr:Aminoacylase-1 [Pseudolycoriella hygida]